VPKGPSKADIVRKQTEEKAAKEAFESKKAYEENKAYEKQIQIRKNEILKTEETFAKNMELQYEKNAVFDGSTGECCLKWANPTAVKCIMIIDIMLIVVDPPRGVAAIQAYKNEGKKAYYARTRMMTFWIYSIVMLAGTIGYIFYEVIQGENPYFVLVLGLLAGVCIWILLDFHYCRCINFWAADALAEDK
jgi:hypothetical protein